MKETVVLVIAHHGYQPIEYGETRKVLEQAGIKVLVASDALETAIASKHVKSHPEYEQAHVDMLVQDIDVESYDGIFFIGGPGALEHLDTEVSYTILKQRAQTNKLFGAICISPRILAKAGVLKHKKATGWDDDQELDNVFQQYGVHYVHEDVVVDGNIITAVGPAVAAQFGHAIVKALKNT